ncbi:hypothetical protein AYI69_g3593 [Smittium culicis]|uniref:Uncharacterized protein n=1 Tax=Smittium culicis TaxID=133412 RepID=A0A1R1YJ95_9FUNG|nr:hypothetical protein AYI69_g3593 [Smittium culicis]
MKSIQDSGKFLTDSVISLLAMRATNEIQPWDPGFYNHIFTVLEKAGELRPVLDLRKLKLRVDDQNFKMVTMTPFSERSARRTIPYPLIFKIN